MVDNWEGLPTKQSAALALRKDSSCITVARGVNPPALTVTFAAASLQEARLSVTWLPCDEPWGGYQVPLGPNTTTASMWQPDDGVAGQVPGVQCDVFRSAAVQPPPPYPWRTDRGATAARSPAFKTRLTNGTWSWSVGQLLPGLQAQFPPSFSPQQLYSVRCWTYLPPMSPGPSPPARLAVTLPDFPLTSASMTLAGRRIWPPPSDTFIQEPILVADNLRSLLVVEWNAVSIDAQLTVTFGNAPLTITTSSMLLPLLVRTPVPGAGPPMYVGTSNYTDPQLPFLGPAGHFSSTYLADPVWDAPTEVQYSLGGLVLQGTFSSPDYGLTGQYFYNASLTSQLRYTLAEGYLQALGYGVQRYVLRMLDGVASATSLVMAPGVTVIDNRPFSSSNQMVPLEVSIVLPQGYVFTEAIEKTDRPDGYSSFYMDVQVPDNPAAAADGPVDNTVWYRPFGRGY